MRKSPAVAGLFRQAEAAAKQRPKSVKNPGVVKGRLPLKLYSGSDGMHVRTDETFRFSYLAGFAARELMREAKPEKTQKSGDQPLF